MRETNSNRRHGLLQLESAVVIGKRALSSLDWPINAADPPGDLENLQLSFEHTGVHSQYFWKKNIKETDPKIKNMFT